MKLDDIPVVGWIIGTLGGEDIDYGFPVFLLGLLFVLLGLDYIGVSQSQVFTLLIVTAPVWLPYITFKIFFHVYMNMVGKKFGIKSGRTIFEIVLPPEVFKSPEAMEIVFTQVFNAANPDNLMETYLDGKRPLPYTFELVSRGGAVKFYATIPEKFAQGFTDAMYAQYPGVELIPQELDYTAEIPNNLKNLSFMSFHFGKKKGSEFPIKTYIDFGMDKMPKEEEKVDPMTPMLEVLAGIAPEQQIWVQFHVKAHREKGFKLGQLKAKGTWEKGVAKEVEKLMTTGIDDPNEPGSFPRITPGQRSDIEAMERNADKAPFEFAARFIYINHKGEGNYDGGLFARMIRTIAQTELKNRNGLGIRWRTDYNYKFLSDPFGSKIPAMKKAELKEYKLRKLYPKSGAMAYKIMTAEEMATIFHLPGTVAQTPTLNRVGSTRAEAPANLPTGNITH